MADDAGVVGWAPAGAEGVDICAADAAVGDADFDVSVGEGLGVEGRVGEGVCGVVGDTACKRLCWGVGGGGGHFGGDRLSELRSCE